MRKAGMVVSRIGTESRRGRFGKVVDMQGKYGMMMGRIEKGNL